MTTPGTPCRSPPGTGSPARSCWPPSAPPPTATGPPAATLTDNGMVFTTRLSGGKGGRNSFEHELRHRGITQKNGRPNHPQTQGIAERFQQTLKNWLAAQDPQPADPAACKPSWTLSPTPTTTSGPTGPCPTTPPPPPPMRPGPSHPRQPRQRHPQPRPPRHHRHHRDGYLALRRPPLPHRHRLNPRRNPHPATRPRPQHPHRQRRHQRTAPPAHPRPHPQLPARPAVTQPQTSTPPKKKITMSPAWVHGVLDVSRHHSAPRAGFEPAR